MVALEDQRTNTNSEVVSRNKCEEEPTVVQEGKKSVIDRKVLR